MKKITLIIACFFAITFQSCYEESFVQTIEPKKGWEVLDSKLDEYLGQRADLTDIFFIDEQTGWAIGSGVILKTTDGGKNWSHTKTSDINQYGYIHFTSETEGWAIGFYSRLMHTTDGGATWQRKEYPGDSQSFSASYLKSLTFNSTGAGAFLGSSRDVYFTLNNGDTWSMQRFNDEKHRSDHLNSVCFTDNNHIWISGERRIQADKYIGLILYSDDGGKTWLEKQFDSLDAIGKIYFLNNQTGWAISTNSTLLSTLDGGLSWDKLPTNTTEGIRDFHFIDEQNGWLIESLPNIMGGGSHYPVFKRTKDGGKTWHYQNFTVNLNKFFSYMQAIHFVNPKIGFAVGSDGVILKTTTGGDLE